MTTAANAPTKKIPYKPLFPLGQIVSTPGALAACTHGTLQRCSFRHSRGDWGNVCGEDAASNREAVTTGRRILSA